MDPSESQFYFIGHEGTASRDIQLFNGNSMTKVVSIFMPSPPPPHTHIEGEWYISLWDPVGVWHQHKFNGTCISRPKWA